MMPIRFYGVLLGVWLVFMSGGDVAAGRNFSVHVAVDGEDANPGTDALPVATLMAAQQRVRQHLRENPQRDVTVWIHDGVYRITEPLVFTREDSAADGFTVTWMAAGDSAPTISGGKPITGWKEHADGSFRTTIENLTEEWEFRELFINGKRRPRARHPNSGYARIEAAGRDKKSYFIFKPQDIPDVLTGELATTGLELVFLHDWSVSRVPVQTIDHAERIVRLQFPVGNPHAYFHMMGWEPQPRYWVENHPSLLDAPGEWYLDRETGVLTYLPVEGELVDSLDAIAPYARSLMKVTGEPGNPIRGLRFHRLNFEHMAWPLPLEGYAGVQATSHQDPRGGEPGMNRIMAPAAILFDWAEDCVFSENAVRHIGGSGVWFRRGASRNRIAGNLIDDISGNGLMIGETRETRSSAVTATANRIEDNIVQRCGMQFHGAVGIWIGYAAETEVKHNLIRHLPYTGISAGWKWSSEPSPSRHTKLVANHIHDVMQMLNDGGGIYTLGFQPESLFADNLIHGIPINAGHAESNGIFFDQGSSGMRVSNNALYHIACSPIRFNVKEANTGVLLERNLLVVSDADTPPIQYGSSIEDNVSLEDNNIIAADEFDPSDFAAFRERVGPRAIYRPVPDPGRTFDLGGPQPPLVFKADFERVAVGLEPPPPIEVRTENQGDRIVVVDSTAAVGRKSLKIQDAPGLTHDFNPHLYIASNHKEGNTRLAFFLRIEFGATLVHEWRSQSYGQTARGPRLQVKEGVLLAGDHELLAFPSDEWVYLELVAPVGKDATGKWELIVTVPGDAPRVFPDLPMGNRDFGELTWIGWFSPATVKQAFYLDGIELTSE